MNYWQLTTCNDSLYPLYAIRYTLSVIRYPLYALRYKNMQNKPNLLDAQMNVRSFHSVDYENKSNLKLGENKPNQTQSCYAGLDDDCVGKAANDGNSCCEQALFNRDHQALKMFYYCVSIIGDGECGFVFWLNIRTGYECMTAVMSLVEANRLVIRIVRG